jgi:hypothetical protein
MAVVTSGGCDWGWKGVEGHVRASTSLGISVSGRIRCGEPAVSAAAGLGTVAGTLSQDVGITAARHVPARVCRRKAAAAMLCSKDGFL